MNQFKMFFVLSLSLVAQSALALDGQGLKCWNSADLNDERVFGLRLESGNVGSQGKASFYAIAESNLDEGNFADQWTFEGAGKYNGNLQEGLLAEFGKNSWVNIKFDSMLYRYELYSGKLALNFHGIIQILSINCIKTE